MKLLTLTILAVATSTVSSLEITFKRYAARDCAEMHHIAKDTNLIDGKCKSFDMHEPVFEAYKFTVNEDEEDLKTKLCYAVLHSGEDCTGEAKTRGSMLLS